MIVTDGGFVARDQVAVVHEQSDDTDREQQRYDEDKHDVKSAHVGRSAAHCLTSI